MAGAIRIIGIDPGPEAHRLGRRRDARQLAALRRGRHGALRREGRRSPSRLCQLHDGLFAVIRDMAPMEAAVEADLRQQGCGRDAEARPGARHRHAGAGAGRARGCRICAERRQEGGDRRRPWREAADPHDGDGADAEGDVRHATTRPTRWRSPSATRITGRARSAGWRRSRPVKPLFLTCSRVGIFLTSNNLRDITMRVTSKGPGDHPARFARAGGHFSQQRSDLWCRGREDHHRCQARKRRVSPTAIVWPVSWRRSIGSREPAISHCAPTT